ncbi:hypothetical protein PWT90_01842 [Aphanocladium album]|nr:hypothetical protein PWT90_01842 [Aphanocladium album]
MKTATFVTAVLSAVCAVSASPVKRETNFGGIAGPLGSLLGNSPAGGLGDSAQAAVAELFKAGDTILNIPGDAARKMLEGDVVGAGAGVVQDVVKVGSDIPKDAMGILGPLGQGLGSQKGQA